MGRGVRAGYPNSIESASACPGIPCGRDNTVSVCARQSRRTQVADRSSVPVHCQRHVSGANRKNLSIPGRPFPFGLRSASPDGASQPSLSMLVAALLLGWPGGHPGMDASWRPKCRRLAFIRCVERVRPDNENPLHKCQIHPNSSVSKMWDAALRTRQLENKTARCDSSWQQLKTSPTQ
jgi:hypothetical protein